MLPLSMDFEQILKQWEEGRRQAAAKRGKGFPPGTGRGGGGQREGDVDMDALLERYPPPAGEDGKAGGREDGEARVQTRYQRLRRSEPEAQLDLHGMTAGEAQEAVERFLRESRGRGLGKVLIIHGKGNHSAGGPVLASKVRQWLERSPLAGAFGPAEPRQGGAGATWVIVRGSESYRSR